MSDRCCLAVFYFTNNKTKGCFLFMDCFFSSRVIFHPKYNSCIILFTIKYTNSYNCRATKCWPTPTCPKLLLLLNSLFDILLREIDQRVAKDETFRMKFDNLKVFDKKGRYFVKLYPMINKSRYKKSINSSRSKFIFLIHYSVTSTKKWNIFDTNIENRTKSLYMLQLKLLKLWYAAAVSI